MSLLVVGISHHSAPIALIDQMALTDVASANLREAVAASPYVAEVMVISTCNRIEVVAEIDRFHGALDSITELLTSQAGVGREDLVPHLYVHYEESAVRHLFAVAAGLDSMVVGEQQIVGQVRSALREAQTGGTAARELNAVGQRALRVAKRVHSETELDRHGTSVVTVALELARVRVGNLSDRSALVIGAGAMSSLAVANLASAGVEQIMIANRSIDSARRLAQTYRATARRLEDVNELLPKVDLVITATGAEGLILELDQLRIALAQRQPDQELVVIDLAVPHDTDPRIGDLAGVCRIDLAQLAAAPGAKASASELRRASLILDEELEFFLAEQAGQRVEPVLISLRAKADVVVQAELARLQAKLPQLSERELATMEQSLRRAVSTLLHTPTVRIKEFAAAASGEWYAEALNVLFDLNATEVNATEVVKVSEPGSGLSIVSG